MEKRSKNIKNYFKDYITEFFIFVRKELRSCIFAGLFFVLLFFSKYITSFGLARYDFLFISAIIIQGLLILLKIETVDELKVICVFHAIGLGLELFKTHPAIHSWSYPEKGFFKIGTVPLYSGFMYASVASYIIQSWRQFNLKLVRYPPYWVSIPMCFLIYGNFFTKHIVSDIRVWLICLLIIIFARTTIRFQVSKRRRAMPLLLSFFLIAFFIWLAENISTFLGAWQYPSQVNGWSLVHLNKISSWFLLFVISFITVADLMLFKYKGGKVETN
ncbi:hypothetical protein A2334_05000 [Candidatus Roizmanbacteria bacterium RIFOXYB2_FULL_38_10]|uniref:DUF817 domain-containing protein n=1 Tax=Candidatus Roizmanbacteria bacterium RIFOXYD1_FULL_38_12 TaxID=1802093 RepID=A0A1F7KZQ3_9BACT|nr:MAG: hypothetical protein A3K47_01100 [Candidatus Roizmanbacteria bacterium RIFOXYA2_FULL_38_14]OGK63382.1 MAG: hypothetical protein A3K27_01100 [Candidatus Roizmanbacteria bacterium RIFOXYA1_FULL_37_12]OGK65228.1 MAG: hypothetical protein A3K38_01100 [Candidatus Roizmanbacteria bacterium RIFOXYB1_FULL_40_23]OGK68781.1 MAG: hypothetical protein A2334_05000 [Candidatus Roizmanbacteria bacterium RIFOXYB2_FULL_38_10]OGK69633.1 MAG: hypothetical protein A3K21_01105 [Candidatus Roizmanbacteria ba